MPEKPAGRATEAPLSRYNAKRDFERTPEPSGQTAQSGKIDDLSFVIQKHWASRLHYDLRLELDGVTQLGCAQGP